MSNRPELLAQRGRGDATPLHVCAERRQIELLALLLQARAVRDAIDVPSGGGGGGGGGDGLTPLACAAQHIVDDDDDQSRLAIVEMLLESGASTQLDNVLHGSQVWFHAALPPLNVASFRSLLRRYASKFDAAWLDAHLTPADRVTVFGP